MSIKKNSVFYLAGIPILLGLIGLVIFALRKPVSSDTPSFLPGIYACQAGNEFCHIDDTVIIHRMNLGGTIYTIHRMSSFVRIIQGKSSPPEHQQENWEGAYDPTHRTLTAAGRSDTIWYLAEKNRIHKNDFIYEKVE
ncbi:MAG TPA: hypothetical protein VGM30_10740 [Puia sp.]